MLNPISLPETVVAPLRAVSPFTVNVLFTVVTPEILVVPFREIAEPLAVIEGLESANAVDPLASGTVPDVNPPVVTLPVPPPPVPAAVQELPGAQVYSWLATISIPNTGPPLGQGPVKGIL
jgi:hypothetical protein